MVAEPHPHTMSVSEPTMSAFGEGEAEGQCQGCRRRTRVIEAAARTSRTQIHPNRMLPARTLAERNDDRYCTVVWMWAMWMWMWMWILDVDLAQSESEAAPEPGLSSPTGSSWSTVMCGGLSVVRSIACLWSRMPCSAPAHSGLREAEEGRGRREQWARASHRIRHARQEGAGHDSALALHCARCTLDLDLIGQLYHPLLPFEPGTQAARYLSWCLLLDTCR